MNGHRSLSHLTILLLSVTPFALGACGLLFTHGPPAEHEQLDSFSCTESNTAPILDIVWGALNLASAATVAGNESEYQNPSQAEASGVVWGLISGFSAGVGFDKTSRCTAAKRKLAERRAKTRAVADVQTVRVTPALDTLAIGEGVQLIASAIASSGAAVPDRPFTWSSSNDAIASVSNSGLVMTHAAGTAVIAANTNTVGGTASIVVVSVR